jgi:hypothetical protein
MFDWIWNLPSYPLVSRYLVELLVLSCADTPPLPLTRSAFLLACSNAFKPVIGELGMHGMNVTGPGTDRVLALRAAQHSVTLMEEFKDTTLFVRTAPYTVMNGTVYNGIYHYYGRADTYFHIGQAFGRGMLQLLKNKLSKAAKRADPADDVSVSVMSSLWMRFVG